MKNEGRHIILQLQNLQCAAGSGEVMRNIPKFDLFRGQYGEPDATWIETVEGLGSAAERMQQLAKEKPGPYFIFHAISRQVLGSVDTTQKSGTNSEVA